MKDGGPPDPPISVLKTAPNDPVASTSPDVHPSRPYERDDEDDDRRSRYGRYGGSYGGYGDDRDDDARSSDAEPASALQNALAWRNRQRMAYIALFSSVIFMAALFFVRDPVRLEKLGSITVFYDGAMVSVVCAFFGFRMYADLKGPRMGR